MKLGKYIKTTEEPAPVLTDMIVPKVEELIEAPSFEKVLVMAVPTQEELKQYRS